MSPVYKTPREITPVQYHKYLKGLPHCEGADQRTVGIVGAGMAGLMAAMLLRGAGFDVRVFEASSRVGGRVRTLRSGFTSGLHAEAGAMRIPEKHKLTLSLRQRFKLKLVDFPEDDANAFVFINGKQARLSSYWAGQCDFGPPYTPVRTATNVYDMTLGCLD